MMPVSPIYGRLYPFDADTSPSGFVECGYYFCVLYAILGPALQISVQFLGVSILAALAALCILRLRSRRIIVYSPIVFPLAAGTSFLCIQVFVHRESLMDTYTRPFVSWMLALMVVHSLSLRRGFLHRFAYAALLIGLTILPYLRIYTATSMFQRAGLEEGIGFANPNDLAAWFGFCAIYFATLGIETTRGGAVRLAAWTTAVACLFIVGLTVSRTSLLASAIAISLSLRRLLNRGLVPVLTLLGLIWLVYATSLFDRIATFYVARGTADTGRLLAWPLALERFLEAPLTGYGVSNVAIYIPSSFQMITPHNGLLFIGLASGVLPLAFFLGYWWHAARGLRRARAYRVADAAFCTPLLVYTFLVMMASNLSFMAPCVIVTLATALTAAHHHDHCCSRQQLVGDWTRHGPRFPISALGRATLGRPTEPCSQRHFLRCRTVE